MPFGPLPIVNHGLSSESLKTDAPNEVVFEILRAWSQKYPSKGSVPQNLLSKERLIKEISFEYNPSAKKSGVKKFLGNPTANWGPGAIEKKNGKKNRAIYIYS